MEVGLIVFMVIMNMITILICWAAYGRVDQYKNGLLLGVHIPATKIYREDVQNICAKTKRFQKWYHSSNLVFSTAITLIGFWKFETWILVQDRMCGTNTTFNKGRPVSKVLMAGTLGITAGILIWVIVLMIQLMTMKVTLEQNGNEFTFQAAGYESTFTAGEIQSVELIDELPDEGFSKSNGSSTEDCKVGKFKGTETGRCMMYLYTDYQPILKIELEDQVIFVNSKKDGEVQKWYRVIKQK